MRENYVSSQFSPLRSSSCAWVSECVCLYVKKRDEKKKGRFSFFYLMCRKSECEARQRGVRSIHTKTTHNLRRTRESYDADRKRAEAAEKHFLCLYMIINLLLFLTFSNNNLIVVRSKSFALSVRTHSVLTPHKENFSTLKYFSSVRDIFCCSAFSPSIVCAYFSFSLLMIIKCTTSGSCRIISYLTPHAIGRKKHRN